MSPRSFLIVVQYLVLSVSLAAEERPIRALLVTGGCCHDYAHQKTVLTEGISARANVVWTIVHEGDGSTSHKVSIYDDPNWADNFDVIVHDECFADVKEAAFVRGILKPHRNGLPAVNLHCAMHCYRVDFENFREWFEFTGLDTRAHGAQLPISLNYNATSNPILAGQSNWTTVAEELYNNIKLEKNVTPLIYGAQGSDSNLVAWTVDYRGTRVFSTTLGHTTKTVGDARYLDLVTRGLLWSVNKLNPQYLKPASRPPRKTAMVPINLALNKQATASGSQEGHPPQDAVDDDPETRWCAPDDKPNYWWQVDLGNAQDVLGCRISWEKENGPYHYTILGSSDGVTWKPLARQTNSPRPQIDEQRFPAVAVRYVRLVLDRVESGAWASFFEFEVLGKQMVEKPLSEVSDRRMAGVRSPPGFEQAIFAAPPDISYPTCLEATPWGDVFVGVDLNGSLDRETNRGRVVRCRDTKALGLADEFKVFARMDSPRGLAFSRNTLFVMHPPVLEAFHDDNGDGIADRSEVLVRGLGNDLKFRGADHTCNGVRMGIDGWLYIALGDYGALDAVGMDGAHLQLHGGGIVRVRPDGSRLSAVVEGTRNIYDVAIDPQMNLFTCDNSNDGDGWNVRLSHMIPTANYGYPSLFKNFPEECMPTMADYGGGSPTGALYLDEPGLPEPYGTGLYTCQWGWNTVTRHPLKAAGASFAADKQTFIRIPRPTGIAADGLGNLYVASWKGATFRYEGTNVGFVLRVSGSQDRPRALPELAKLSSAEVLKVVGSDSATCRLHAQQELLARGFSPATAAALAELAKSGSSRAIRSAAVFTLGQFQGAEAEKLLVSLSDNAELKRVVLIALSDSLHAAAHAKFFVQHLSDRDASVRLQAVTALNRTEQHAAAEQIAALLTDPDSAVAHAAFRALVRLKAADTCLSRIKESAGSAEAVAALRVLGNIHEAEVVNALIAKSTEFNANSALHWPVVETLCRLSYREAAWDGSWWTTRPDTKGPYYKPEAWAQTPRIASFLEERLRQSNKQDLERWNELFHKYSIPSAALAAVVAGKGPSRVEPLPVVYKPAQPAAPLLPKTGNKGGDTIGSVPYEKVVNAAITMAGEPKRGAALFESIGCVKCHTVSAKEAPKGPFLGDITVRYSKEELIESMLRPNAKIAQGFESVFVETKDGETHDGFIVRESGSEVEVRNLNGALTIPKEDIARRGTRQLSIMPEGLLNASTPGDLASLIAYLRSLASK
jgi:putative heme-binding domain-containing protein